MPGEKRDYYEVLGVARDATGEEIKRAFRKLAMEFHPDRNSAPDAADRFKQIGEAYEVLSDPEKRATFDRVGMGGNFGGGVGFEGFEFGGFGDIFDAFFGGRRQRRGPVRGRDLRVPLDLSFVDAAFGAEKEIRVARLENCSTCGGNGAEPGTGRVTCPLCQGAGEIRRAQRSVFGQFVNVSICERCEGDGQIIEVACHHCAGQGREQRNRRLKVKVPAGVDDGSQMRLTSEGDAGLHGGPAGNLYVELRVQPHEIFARDGDDLVLQLPLNVAQAALGTDLDVPTLDGDAAPLTVPAGTQHGEVFRLKRLGIPHLRGKGRGDLRVEVRVAVPHKISARQRELFEELAASLAEADGDDRGLFSRLRDAFTA